MLQTYHKNAALIRNLNYILLISSIIALISLIFQYGFYPTKGWEVLVTRFNFLFVEYYVIQFFLKLLLAEKRITYLRAHWYEAVLSVLIILETAIVVRILGINLIARYFSGVNIRVITELYVIIAQVMILLSFIPILIRYNQKISELRFHPGQVIILSFLVTILAGALLLLLPKSVTYPNRLTFIDALFSATSAVCVTGLSVVDIGTFFSPLGQIIILLLIQLGGIGTLTLTCFLALLFGKGMALKERVVLHDFLLTDKLGLLSSTLRDIMVMVFSVELAGTLLLMLLWKEHFHGISTLFYYSLFHSVSAFCNAGFSLFPDSLIRYKESMPVMLVFCALIIIGGLGFTTISNLLSTTSQRLKHEFKPHYRVHTKLTVYISLILIVSGVLLYLLLESRQNGISLYSDMLAALFTSVTARTAGFNSIDMATLSIPFALFVVVLMFIGASPGSTGGGIKTTTLGILLISIYSIMLGKRRIVIWGKDIPFLVLNRALIVFTAAIFLVVTSTILLSITDSFPLVDTIFEVVSGFATVGLSRGITAYLSVLGKLIIIITMFIGRVGILTMAFSITSLRDQKVRIEYPSEMVGVG